MPLLNYTTSIDHNKTIGEIQGVLAKHGVKSVMITYDDGMPNGLDFSMLVRGTELCFRLPCNYLKLFERLKRDPKVANKFKNSEQALRVSWRILKVWVEAQVEMIETDLVTMEQVFLPYLLNEKKDQTVFDLFQGSNLKLLS